MKTLNISFQLTVFGALCLLHAESAGAQNRVLPDPTKPPVVVGEEVVMSDDGQISGAVKLSAIFIRPSNRSAVINNDTVVEGQIWNGMEVVAIHPEKVVLKNESGTQELILNDVIIKRDAQNEF